MAGSPSLEGQRTQCSLCLLHCEKVSTRGAQLVCAGCVNVSSMLQYKLGGKVSTTLEDKVAFFRKAKSTGSGRLEWKTVRALVKEHMILRKIKQSEVSVGGKYLPMNVHLAAGWTEGQVTAKNDFMEDPELGKVWRVPVMEKTVRQIDEEIEEELTTKEQEVTKSRQAKKRKPQEGGQEEADLDLPSATAQSNAGDSNKVAKKEQQEEAKAARLTLKNNKAQAALAAKAVASLSTLLSSLNSAKGFAAKLWEELPQDLRTSLTEALTTAVAWKTAATSALQFQENNEQAALKDPAAPLQPLPALPFTAETFHDYEKAAKAAVKELRRAARDKKKTRLPLLLTPPAKPRPTALLVKERLERVPPARRRFGFAVGRAIFPEDARSIRIKLAAQQPLYLPAQATGLPKKKKRPLATALNPIYEVLWPYTLNPKPVNALSLKP